MRWFRFYSSVLTDPKVQRLPIALRWRWVELLCLASENSNRGYLPSLENIAFATHQTRQNTEKLVATLTDVGLLDRKGRGALQPHNWDGRQFASDNVTGRVRKHRRNASVTPEKGRTATPKGARKGRERGAKGTPCNVDVGLLDRKGRGAPLDRTPIHHGERYGAR